MLPKRKHDAQYDTDVATKKEVYSDGYKEKYIGVYNQKDLIETWKMEILRDKIK